MGKQGVVQIGFSCRLLPSVWDRKVMHAILNFSPDTTVQILSAYEFGKCVNIAFLRRVSQTSQTRIPRKLTEECDTAVSWALLVKQIRFHAAVRVSVFEFLTKNYRNDFRRSISNRFVPYSMEKNTNDVTPRLLPRVFSRIFRDINKIHKIFFNSNWKQKFCRINPF